MSNKKHMVLGLCESRHPMPECVEGYIFPREVENVFDFDALAQTVDNALKWCGKLDLYLTGLTSCTLEVVNYCIYNNIDLTVYHWDIKSNQYVPQTTYTDFWKPFLQESGYIGRKD